jgi:two-component system nitrogen regulation response regulator NtrX
MSDQEMKQSILVVDDEPSVLDLCDRYLTREGYTVCTASSAAQARQQLAERAFDLLIVDVYLPDEGGVSLLKYVRQQQPDLPTMLITGRAGAGTMVDAIRLNVREYLCKPFALHALRAAVERSLEAGKTA